MVNLVKERNCLLNCRCTSKSRTSWLHKMVLFSRVPNVSSRKGLRPKIKEKLHRSHIGVQGSLRRARKVVYWPNMNREVAEFISKWETCNTFQSAQQKEPLICHETPQHPWEKIGRVIFTFNNQDYLCTVEYSLII